MKKLCSCLLMFSCLVFFLALAMLGPSTARAEKPIPGSMAEKVPKPNASFDVSKMSDMSDYDPAHWVSPTGDTIKIALVQPFSGPGALNGQIFLAPLQFAAHDINKRGGIWVDGKKKLIEVIAADHMSKPDQCKKICERMVLQEKVQILMGTSGSNLMKVINEVANKYKIIAVNEGALSDDLMDATNFGRYSFMTSPDTTQIGRGLAYFYGQIRKKEKKFYILCQDYSFGHSMAESFKKGLQDYFPEAQVVGEDFHKLFLTDFAPYLTKIKASGAEVIYTGDWLPDGGNLLKQARQMGIKLPFANLFINEPISLTEVGIEGTKGLIHIDIYDTPSALQVLSPDHQVLQGVEQPLENKMEDASLQQRSLSARGRAVRRPDLLALQRDREGKEHGPGENSAGLGRRHLPVPKWQDRKDEGLRSQDDRGFKCG